jgi:hypothetical protein
MKKISYFVGATLHNPGDPADFLRGVEEVVSQREQFVSNNIKEIAKIEGEELIITPVNSNLQPVIFIIKFTYYEKDQ